MAYNIYHNPYKITYNTNTTGITGTTIIYYDPWNDNTTWTTNEIYYNKPNYTINVPECYVPVAETPASVTKFFAFDIQKLKAFLKQSIKDNEESIKKADEKDRVWFEGFTEALQEVFDKIEEIENQK